MKTSTWLLNGITKGWIIYLKIQRKRIVLEKLKSINLTEVDLWILLLNIQCGSRKSCV